MRDCANKAELLLMIANAVSQIKDVPTSIIAAVNEKMIYNGFDKDFGNIMQPRRSIHKINSSCF